MFNLTILITSIFAPAALILGLRFSDRFLKTELFRVVLALIYLEHLYLGYILGMRFEKGLTGGWISIPGSASFLTATSIFDYLLVALAVYVSLMFLTARIASA